MRRFLTVLKTLALLNPALLVLADEKAEDVVLAIHGGVGVVERARLTPERKAETLATLRKSLLAGFDIVHKADGHSLDAVETAIRILEDSPLFNAGRGAAFTIDGRNELDACIMNGKDRKAGAVANVSTIKNPIHAARLVMEKSPHVLLTGLGADQFAQRQGAEIVPPSYFRTEERWQLYQEELERRKKLPANSPAEKSSFLDRKLPGHMRLGTVGCVALDLHGNLAAGTSTGGTTLKLPGRVGGAPIVGSATYADNRNCAVSGTGDGEYFLRTVAAHTIALLVEYRDMDVAAASRQLVHETIAKDGGEAGILVLDPKGRLAITYNTPGMYRGYITRDGKVFVAIYEAHAE